MRIGLGTSTVFAPDMEQAFRNGLGPRWREVNIDPRAARGNYDDKEGGDGGAQELNEIMKHFQTGDHALVIAAGGVVSARAAVKKVTKPFLVLIGNEPTGPDALDETNPDYNFCGGINLNTISQNVHRRRYLIDLYTDVPDTDNAVCLLWNKKSWMGNRDEKRLWNKNWHDVAVKTNDVAEFPVRFAEIAQINGCRGVVISSDAFFYFERNELVQAANLATTLTVCYPMEKYLENSAPGKSMWYGPNLLQGYKYLGAKAAIILDDLKLSYAAPKTGLDKLPPSPYQTKPPWPTP